MRPLVWSIAAAAVAAAAAFTIYAFGHQSGPAIETIDLSRPNAGGPAMCPWRDPNHDLVALFPGASGYRTETLVLSSRRLAVVKRMGPKYHIETMALYAYRALRHGDVIGTVLVRRAAGPHGAFEVVVGVDSESRVTGVRIQRIREPNDVVAAVTSPAWLAAFRRKTADSRLVSGDDVPPVPPAAAEAAADVALAVRAILVEKEEAERSGSSVPAGHHELAQ